MDTNSLGNTKIKTGLPSKKTKEVEESEDSDRDEDRIKAARETKEAHL